MKTRSKRNIPSEGEVVVKKTRRKLRYNAVSSKLREENEPREEETLEILTPPPHSDDCDVNLNPTNSNIITKTIVGTNEECLLFQIPKSVSFEIICYLDSENLVNLEMTTIELLELVREDVSNRIRSLYKTHHIPLSQFAEHDFWEYKWWLTNIVTGGKFESSEKSFEATRLSLGSNTLLSSPTTSSTIQPCLSSPIATSITSVISPNGSMCRSATKVLEMFKDERVLRRDLYGSGESFLNNIDAKFRKCGVTRQDNREYTDNELPIPLVYRHSSSSSSNSGGGGGFSLRGTPQSSCRVIRSDPLLLGSMQPDHIAHGWLKELNKWDNATHVPRDGSLEEVIELADHGSHIILAPGVHVLSDMIVVRRSLQIIGAVNEKNMPISIIKATRGVFRVTNEAHVGLFGVGIWCYSSDFTRRNAVIVDPSATLFASYSQIKCVSGRYCGGILVQADASVLLCDCSISACTGSGVILFGSGQFEHCEFFDNHFNGIEVQKGGEAYMSYCHVHSNGYCSNEEDLGSGVTCCGATSLVWMRDSFIHGNQGGGLIVQSSAKAIAQGCQLSMNHAGHEFGDLDVDTESDVVLEYCLLKGNGQHGREQYSVICAQRKSVLTLRHCFISCDPISFGTGIDVQNGAELKLDRCEIYRCSGSGVLLRDANVSVQITRSKLHDNKLHGVEVQAGEVDISDCDISDNMGHDIYISETNGTCKYKISKTNATSFSAIDDKQSKAAAGEENNSD